MATYVTDHLVTVIKSGWLCNQGHVHTKESSADSCDRKALPKKRNPVSTYYRRGFAMVARENGWTYRKIAEMFGVSSSYARQCAQVGIRIMNGIITRPDIERPYLEEFQSGMDDARNEK